MKKSLTSRRLLAVVLAVAALSPAWLGGSGLSLLVGFIPLLWISSSYGDDRASWWRMFGWALLTFVGWNVATVWWIWNATPVGPIAATLFSTFWNMLAFMTYHTVSKRAPKLLSYIVLLAGWIATEYWYTMVDFSWPWLILGNGFSHDVRLVQWYEYTGVFGGSLWVLLSNILLFEAMRSMERRRWVVAAVATLLPIALSLGIFLTWEEPDRRIKVAVLQPNVDCYEKFAGGDLEQEQNLMDLLLKAPTDADFIIAPETALTRYMDEEHIEDYAHIRPFLDTLASRYPHSTLISGANTVRFYRPGEQTETARATQGYWYDHFNTAVGMDSAGVQGLYHKGRLVIGVENTPTWVFRVMRFLVVDLGGVLGQIGVGEERRTFHSPSGVEAGAAICYEGLYGDFYGDFVRKGAEVMLIISNDGWWGDTPGYRHLFSISRLRAVEHRRAIARSANTGRSGFIDCRGEEVGPTLGWDERGVITYTLALNTAPTFYTRWGDYIGRLAQLIVALSLLYYMAWRVKRRSHLVP